MGRILLECPRLLGVGEDEQAPPVLRAQCTLTRGDLYRVGDRAIARENAAAEEVLGGWINRKLEVPVEIAGGNPLGEEAIEVVGSGELDDPLELPPRRQPKRDGVDSAEEAVAADDEAKELRVFLTAAREHRSVRGHESQRLDVSADRPQRKPAPVGIDGH